jgi:hypothetical protein
VVRCEVFFFIIIDTFVSLAIPSLQLRLTTSLFSNLDSKLKTYIPYLSIDQYRVLVLICSHDICQYLRFDQCRVLVLICSHDIGQYLSIDQCRVLVLICSHDIVQYLSIDQCRVLVLICSQILLRPCLAQIPLALCSAFNSDHYAH